MFGSYNTKQVLFITINSLSPFTLYWLITTFTSFDFAIAYVFVTSIVIAILSMSVVNNLNTKQKLLLKQQLMIDDGIEANRRLLRSMAIREAMLEISNSMINTQNLDDLLQDVMKKVITVIDNADMGSILIRNDEDRLVFRAAHGFELSQLSNISLSLEETYFYDVDDNGKYKPRIIKNPRVFDHYVMSPENLQEFEKANVLNIKATITAPILIDQDLYGMINIDNSHNEDAFDDEALTIIEFLSYQLGIAIKNARLLERIVYLSRYDGLTGIYNRCYFDEVLDQLLLRAKRYDETFILCLLDMDNLKQINDSLGHQAGDLAITFFAKTLKEHIRETDLLSRYGGDEFILVFLNMDLETAHKKLEEIARIISSEKLTYQDHGFEVKFSYGVSSYPRDTSNKKDLIKIADGRMYSYKEKQKAMQK
ncbi:MAG: diguanylate cyclase [Bacillota bacterium]